MDFSVFIQAGLINNEVARMLGVSTVMSWKYLNGKATIKKAVNRRVNQKARAETAINVVSKLLEKGSLPKSDLTWKARMDPELRTRRDAMINKLIKLVDERVANTPANE